MSRGTEDLIYIQDERGEISRSSGSPTPSAQAGSPNPSPTSQRWINFKGLLFALESSGLCLECLAARLYTSFVTSYAALSVHAPKGATLLSIPNQATPGLDRAHAYGTEVPARRCLIAQHEAGYGLLKHWSDTWPRNQISPAGKFIPSIGHDGQPRSGVYP